MLKVLTVKYDSVVSSNESWRKLQQSQSIRVSSVILSVGISLTNFTFTTGYFQPYTILLTWPASSYYNNILFIYSTSAHQSTLQIIQNGARDIWDWVSSMCPPAVKLWVNMLMFAKCLRMWSYGQLMMSNVISAITIIIGCIYWELFKLWQFTNLKIPAVIYLTDVMLKHWMVLVVFYWQVCDVQQSVYCRTACCV